MIEAGAGLAFDPAGPDFFGDDLRITRAFLRPQEGAKAVTPGTPYLPVDPT
jgi:hypothetical protein